MREPRINGFGIPVLFHANKRGPFECEQRRQAPSRSRFSCALASASRTASPSCWTEKGFGRKANPGNEIKRRNCPPAYPEMKTIGRSARSERKGFGTGKGWSARVDSGG